MIGISLLWNKPLITTVTLVVADRSVILKYRSTSVFLIHIFQLSSVCYGIGFPANTRSYSCFKQSECVQKTSSRTFISFFFLLGSNERGGEVNLSRPNSYPKKKKCHWVSKMLSYHTSPTSHFKTLFPDNLMIGLYVSLIFFILYLERCS